jgi:hypothetical protein
MQATIAVPPAAVVAGDRVTPASAVTSTSVLAGIAAAATARMASRRGMRTPACSRTCNCSSSDQYASSAVNSSELPKNGAAAAGPAFGIA